MEIKIWDNTEQKYIHKENVKRISQSKHYFKIDNKKYDIPRYKLDFVRIE